MSSDPVFEKRYELLLVFSVLGIFLRIYDSSTLHRSCWVWPLSYSQDYGLRRGLMRLQPHAHQKIGPLITTYYEQLSDFLVNQLLYFKVE